MRAFQSLQLSARYGSDAGHSADVGTRKGRVYVDERHSAVKLTVRLSVVKKFMECTLSSHKTMVVALATSLFLSPCDDLRSREDGLRVRLELSYARWPQLLTLKHQAMLQCLQIDDLRMMRNHDQL